MSRTVSKKLTANFWEHEFDCNCCGKYIDAKQIAMQLQVLRNFINNELKPVTPIRLRLTNGLRCKAHNKNVGGVSNSRHLPKFYKIGEGAADVYSPDISARKLRKLFKKAWKAGIVSGGAGLYWKFIHSDTSSRRFWGRFWGKPK